MNDLSLLAGQAAQLAERLAALADVPLPDAEPPQLLTDLDRGRAVRRYLHGSRKRISLVADEVFADPAWSILLELFAARVEGRPQSISTACAAAGVAPTTALRWVKCLIEFGCIECLPAAADGEDDQVNLPQAVYDDIAGWVDRCLLRSQ